MIIGEGCVIEAAERARVRYHHPRAPRRGPHAPEAVRVPCLLEDAAHEHLNGAHATVLGDVGDILQKWRDGDRL